MAAHRMAGARAHERADVRATKGPGHAKCTALYRNRPYGELDVVA